MISIVVIIRTNVVMFIVGIATIVLIITAVISNLITTTLCYIILHFDMPCGILLFYIITACSIAK